MIGTLTVLKGRIVKARSLLRLRPFDVSTAEGRSAERYRRILLTTATGLAARVFGAVVSLVTVPLTLWYLGTVRYGFWALISTAVTWFSLLGLNITGGLRNAVAEAHGRDDRDSVIAYASTAFVALIGIAGVSTIGVIALSSVIDWASVLGVSAEVPREIAQGATTTALVLFLVGLPAAIPSTIFSALQRQYVSNIINLVGVLITVPSLYLAIHFKASISVLLIAISGGPLVASIVSQAYLRFVSEPWLSISFRKCSRRALKRIAHTSIPMIGYQIGSLMVNETQQIIIARRLNLATVSSYAILMRIIILTSSVVALSTAGFLPAIREAKERGDVLWMNVALKRMIAVRVAIVSVAGAILLVSGNPLLRLWLRRDDLQFETIIWLIVVAGMITSTWATAFIDFMTAMDDIWKQLILVFVNGVSCIGLSILLTPRFGLTGVMIATYGVAILLWSWVVPWMARRS